MNNRNHPGADRPQRSTRNQFVRVDLPSDERERLDRVVTDLSGCVALMRQQPQLSMILEQLKRVNANVKMSVAFAPKA